MDYSTKEGSVEGEETALTWDRPIKSADELIVLYKQAAVGRRPPLTSACSRRLAGLGNGNTHKAEGLRDWGSVVAEQTLCRVPLESPRKAMLWPSRTLTATAVRRAAECSHEAFASSAVRPAIGLGVWSEPHGYAFTVFCAEGNHSREAGQLRGGERSASSRTGGHSEKHEKIQ